MVQSRQDCRPLYSAVVYNPHGRTAIRRSTLTIAAVPRHPMLAATSVFPRCRTDGYGIAVNLQVGNGT